MEYEEKWEKGKRIKDKGLGRVLGKTKAVVDAAIPRIGGGPARAAEVLRIFHAPGSAPQEPTFIFLVVPACAPLPDISGHVLAAIGTLAFRTPTDRRCSLLQLSN